MASEDLSFPQTRTNLLLATLGTIIPAVHRITPATSDHSIDNTLVSLQRHAKSLSSHVSHDQCLRSRRSDTEIEIIRAKFRALDILERLLPPSAFLGRPAHVHRWPLLNLLNLYGPPIGRSLITWRPLHSWWMIHQTDLQDIVNSLQSLLSRESANASPAAVPLDLISSIRRVRGYINGLVLGMTNSVGCGNGSLDCHGCLLFLESHLRSPETVGHPGQSSPHDFRLLLSEGRPDQTPWRFGTIEIYNIEARYTPDMDISDNVLGDHFQASATLRDPFRMSVDTHGPRTRPYLSDFPPTYQHYRKQTILLEESSRVPLGHFLNDLEAGSSLTTEYRFLLAQLLAISTVQLTRGALLGDSALSRSNICFLQTLQSLHLQPFLFTWFPPNHTVTAEYGPVRDSSLAGLAVLLTEIFFHATIETLRNDNETDDLVTVSRLYGRETHDIDWGPYVNYRSAVRFCLEESLEKRDDEQYCELVISKVLTALWNDYQGLEGLKESRTAPDWQEAERKLSTAVIARLGTDTTQDSPFTTGRRLFDNFDDFSHGPQNTFLSQMDGINAKFQKEGIKSASKIAVLDTGIDASHSDFNGSRERIHQMNWLDPGNEPKKCPDDHGHGTFIAGLLVRATGGRLGRTKLFIGRVNGARYAPGHPDSITAFEKGIEWAIGAKVDILSISFGYPQHSAALGRVRQLLIDAHGKGIIVIAAAGNDGLRRDEPAWPASLGGTVMCANSAKPDRSPSDFNPVAKGENNIFIQTERIRSAWLKNASRVQSGTSWSAPALAALAALALEWVGSSMSPTSEPHLRAARDKLHTLEGMTQVFRELGITKIPKDGEFIIEPEGLFNWTRMDFIALDMLSSASRAP